jgi:hypothetical protein
MWPRRIFPDDEVGFDTARLETVMRRYGFVVDPVLWQIVILVGGVLVGAGVAVGDGHAAVPTTTASPVWRRCARSTFPEREFGLVIARLETRDPPPRIGVRARLVADRDLRGRRGMQPRFRGRCNCHQARERDGKDGQGCDD